MDFVIVKGDSMNPTYQNGAVVFFEKQYETVNRYDVVIVSIGNLFKGKIIKRVIGLPGDRVQIINGFVYINGEQLLDDVVNDSMTESGIAENEIVLGADEYFLLGDNRNASEDSRSEWLGIIKKKQIIGKVNR